MDGAGLRRILERTKTGEITIDQAERQLSNASDLALGFATLDRSRALRLGNGEVVFCQGKTAAEVVEIAGRLVEADGTVLATRAEAGVREALAAAFPDARIHEAARMVEVERRERSALEGLVAVISAGTADIPVAEEAMVTLRWTGSRAEPVYDVGVAGIHRLLGFREILERARVLVVVAGMDGALPSVVAGLFAAPVIAVPTSVGYGAALGGLSALLAMLSSCAPGLTVVGIDNGFGAGYAASRINRMRATS